MNAAQTLSVPECRRPCSGAASETPSGPDMPRWRAEEIHIGFGITASHMPQRAIPAGVRLDRTTPGSSATGEKRNLSLRSTCTGTFRPLGERQWSPALA